MPKHIQNEVCIKSIKDRDTYWQCGQWVTGIENATLYRDEEEANKVILTRNLHDVEVI